MLHIKKVLGAKPKEHVEAELEELLTPWGEALDPAHVLEEHPDPQFARTSYTVLNGTWECAFVEDAYDCAEVLGEVSQAEEPTIRTRTLRPGGPAAPLPNVKLRLVVESAQLPAAPESWQPIVVPFSPESTLSGVGRQLRPGQLLWYRRTFDAPELGENALMLHFQAVDYACAVFVNGQFAGSHVGGYTPFSIDIAPLIKAGQNELAVCVADPSEAGGGLRGKQRLDRGDIWYTAQSGIWQTVWLESVPTRHIESIAIEPSLETGILTVGARISTELLAEEKDDSELTLRVFDGEKLVAEASAPAAEATCALAAHIANVRPWSPDDPHLYRLELRLGEDLVQSYCGFRSVEVKVADDGAKRFFLNGKPLFIRGVLDQAYWSDGLMTAPADDALIFDIDAMRSAGFNLMRKHIKIESARWYYHCDRMGMLVLQDMVCGGAPEIQTWHWSYKPTLFKVSWTRYRDDTASHQTNLGAAGTAYQREWLDTCAETLRVLGNHPSIIGWSLFNEGWGQFNAKEACQLVRGLDPSRPIDATSGWYDQGCGDFFSVHNYFRDMKIWRDRLADRAFFVSEFGGYTHRVDGHSALDEAYGYEPYDTVEEWRAAVHGLLASMDALEKDGLAGYIYTQVSDIEEETNGILTYDRHANKLAQNV